jgi:CMP/dCMP kinase
MANDSMKHPIIAIDGPAGSGKSTVAKALAKRLSYVHIDTGALYRAVAFLALDKGVSLADEAAVVDAAKDARFEFKQTPEGNHLHINGQNMNGPIRSEAVGLGASQVSAFPKVRALLLGLQRELGRKGGAVLEGRDIGTVVFPKAEVKIYLTASITTRAKRRANELEEKGQSVDLSEIEREMAKRDKQDTERAIAPLRQAPDARLVDTSNLSLEEVLLQLEAMVDHAVSN